MYVEGLCYFKNNGIVVFEVQFSIDDVLGSIKCRRFVALYDFHVTLQMRI